MTRSLLWFRRNLRVADNPALEYALNNSEQILALYIQQPLQGESHHRGSRQQTFIQANLACLQKQLAGQGIELMQVTWSDYRETLRALPKFIEKQDINLLIANREHGISEQRRDHSPRSQLEIPFARFNADCILESGSVRNRSSEMFRVFTPFRNQWLKTLLAQGYALADSSNPQAAAENESTGEC